MGGLATSRLEALCSPWLASSDMGVDGDSSGGATPVILRVFPKPTQEFHMPTSIDRPLILIGPGTGVAPFMGFLAHRRAVNARSSGISTVGSPPLGCRDPGGDVDGGNVEGRIRARGGGGGDH